MPAAARIVELDALRGLALLGILLVNIGQFASSFHAVGLPDPVFDRVSDRLTTFAVLWLLGSKFYLIFAFLFGYSVAVQKQAAERAGIAFAPRFLRRQAALWLIGLLHALLLFHGDILTTYAVLGVVLLRLSGRSDRGLLRVAREVVVAIAGIWLILGIVTVLLMPEIDLGPGYNSAFEAIYAYRGSPAAVIGQHIEELLRVAVTLLLVQAPCALAMLLVGFVAGRNRFVEAFALHKVASRRRLCLGLAIGLLAAAPSAFFSTTEPVSAWAPLALSVSLLTAPLLAGTYVALALLGFRSGIGARLRDWLAPAGRMALSNYLAQSLICAFIFHGYGFGLVGELSPLAAMGIGVLIFLFQLALSGWWLNRFGRGPLEMLMPRMGPPASVRVAPAG